MSAIINVSNSEKLDMGFDAWKLMEHDDTAIIRINMETEHSIEAHVNDKTVIFYVLNGEGELSIDNSVNRLKGGDSIKVEKGKMRAWTVTGDSSLELLVMKFM